MQDRIKEIRKEKNLTQQELGDLIGLSRNFIAQIEMGTKIPSDRTIKDICRIFHINEDWLRNGNGEMTSPRTKNQQIADFLNETMEEPNESFKKNFVNGLAQLDYNDWLEIERLIRKITKKD